MPVLPIEAVSMSTLCPTLDSVAPVHFNEPRYAAGEQPSFDLIGDSAATRRLRLQIERIGPHFRTVLVQGEMGTGKELVARALHAKSRGTAGPFSTLYGAALAEAIGEGESDARSPWQALFERQTGTIFLDGVDELPLPAQARLLDHLTGFAHQRTAPPRLIAATGQSLERMLSAGRFRPDLYHRLATIEIVIEPLRRRRDDIPALAEHLVSRFAAVYGRETIAVAECAMLRLRQYDWPGNVREMENVLRNGVLGCDGDVLESSHLGSLLRVSDVAASLPSETAEVETLQQVVERHVLHVLQLCSGNKVRAAEMLGISRSTLYRMLESCSPLVHRPEQRPERRPE
jgi:DNA-binding NtrC family response regulator